MHLLLQGVVGSVAYGLSGPDSDVDRAGIFAWPTAALFGLTAPAESLVTHVPEDRTLHEAAKACRLILGGNPTASEILWLEKYEQISPLGLELIHIRGAFLCAAKVKGAYLGYADQQFKKLLARGDGSFNSDIPARRAAKHARHLMRLVEQGYQLYTTGALNIRVEDPARCIDFGLAAAADPHSATPYMAEAEARFAAARTVLPAAPRIEIVEDWLRRVRDHYYRPEAD